MIEYYHSTQKSSKIKNEGFNSLRIDAKNQ
jgi:hypothetical protein